MHDLIKTYEGNLILPFGTPYFITTSWETDRHYHTQSFTFLDCLDHTVDISLHYQPFTKSAPDGYLPSSLSSEDALKSTLAFGYDMAYKSIPRSLWNYRYSKQPGNTICGYSS